MRKSAFSRIASSVLAIVLSAATLSLADTPPAAGYRSFSPMASLSLENGLFAVSVLRCVLSGTGAELSEADCSARLARMLLLPSFDCVDKTKRIRCYLLSKDPPSSLPEPALVVPLSLFGPDEIVKGFKQRYKTVEGGGIKICIDPVDGKSVEPLYFAIANGQALISTSADGIRWLAYNLQSSSLPEAKADFRDAPVSLSVNSQMLGMLLELVASLDASSVPEDATAGNALLHIRELGKFFSLLSSVDVTLSASMTQLDVALRLNPSEDSPLAEPFAAMPAPYDEWMRLFPPLTQTRSIDSFASFVSALPHSNRRWLSSLADNIRFVGYSIFPAMPGLDEAVRPLLTGREATQFLAGKPGAMLGALSVYEVTDPAALAKELGEYFSADGAATLNSRIGKHGERTCGDAKVFEVDISPKRASASSGAAQTGVTMSYAIDLNHVEIALKGTRMIVARGPSGLIDKWLSDRPVTTWDEKASVFSDPFPPLRDGEVFLGGGTVAPIALVRGIIGCLPDARHLLSKLPHPGDGFGWRMSRSGSSAIFDFKLFNSEVLACSALCNMRSEDMQEFVANSVFRNFQRSADEENRHEKLRVRLQELRDK